MKKPCSIVSRNGTKDMGEPIIINDHPPAAMHAVCYGKDFSTDRRQHADVSIWTSMNIRAAQRTF